MNPPPTPHPPTTKARLGRSVDDLLDRAFDGWNEEDLRRAKNRAAAKPELTLAAALRTAPKRSALFVLDPPGSRPRSTQTH